MDRRTFLNASGATAAGAAVLGPVGSAAAKALPADVVPDAFDLLAAGRGATLNRKAVTVRGYLAAPRGGHRHYVMLTDRAGPIDPQSRDLGSCSPRMVRVYIDAPSVPASGHVEVEVSGRMFVGRFSDLPSETVSSAVMTGARVRPVA